MFYYFSLYSWNIFLFFFGADFKRSSDSSIDSDLVNDYFEV
jgi:hypothetical protein